MLGGGGVGQHGVVAAGMEAKDDLGTRWFFDPQALGTDGHAAIVAHAERGADAPDIWPPRTGRHWPQDGTFFFQRRRPRLVRGLPEFAVDFFGVVMVAQRGDVPVGLGEFGNFFTGEAGGQPALPELMFAFDFAFGLRCGRVAQADVIELQGRAELRERVGRVGEEQAVVVHIQLERTTVFDKSGGEEVQIGEEGFTGIELGASKDAAAIVQHIEHGERLLGPGEPAVRGGVELPEFTELGALPTADGGADFFGWLGMG